MNETIVADLAMPSQESFVDPERTLRGRAAVVKMDDGISALFAGAPPVKPIRVSVENLKAMVAASGSFGLPAVVALHDKRRRLRYCSLRSTGTVASATVAGLDVARRGTASEDHQVERCRLVPDDVESSGRSRPWPCSTAPATPKPWPKGCSVWCRRLALAASPASRPRRRKPPMTDARPRLRPPNAWNPSIKQMSPFVATCGGFSGASALKTSSTCCPLPASSSAGPDAGRRRIHDGAQPAARPSRRSTRIGFRRTAGDG